MRKVRQLLGFATQDVLRDSVSLCCALHDQRSEAGEVRCGNLIGVTDERVEIGKLPQAENGGQKRSRSLFVDSKEHIPQGLMADSAAGSLIGQRRAPSTGSGQIARGSASGDVRARAGHHEDTGPAEESSIERNFHIA